MDIVSQVLDAVRVTGRINDLLLRLGVAIARRPPAVQVDVIVSGIWWFGGGGAAGASARGLFRNLGQMTVLGSRPPFKPVETNASATFRMTLSLKP